MSDQQGYNQNWQSQYQQPQQYGQPQHSSGYVFNQMTGQWEVAGGGGYGTPKPKWPGILSCAIAGLSLLLFIAACGSMVAFFVQNPQFQNNPQAVQNMQSPPGMVIFAGCGVFVAAFGFFVGLIVGVVGLAMSSVQKGWAIAGTVSNGLFVLCIGCLFLIGLASP